MIKTCKSKTAFFTKPLSDENFVKIVFGTNYVQKQPRNALTDAKRQLTKRILQAGLGHDGLETGNYLGCAVKNVVMPSFNSAFTSPKQLIKAVKILNLVVKSQREETLDVEAIRDILETISQKEFMRSNKVNGPRFEAERALFQELTQKDEDTIDMIENQIIFNL